MGTEPFVVHAPTADRAPWVMLATSDRTGGAVAFGHAVLPPRTAGPALHVHQREDEASCVVKGVLTVQLGDERIEAGPGSLVWLPRGVPHTFANLSDEEVQVFGTIVPGGLEEMFAEQAAYFAGLTGPPDEAEIDAIGARYGVTRVGPPIAVPAA